MPKLSLNASKKTKHTPAGDIPVDWAARKLGDLVAQPISGVSVVAHDKPPESGYPGVLRLSCVTGGRFNRADLKMPQNGQASRLNVYAEKDTILVSRSNTPSLVGASAYVPEDYPTAFLPDTLWLLRAKNPSAVSMRWLSYLIRSDEYRRLLQNIASGTSQSMKKIQKGALLKLNAPTPPLSEQLKIADILSTWDESLETLDALIAAKTRQKQALMQQLLTGKTRVKGAKGKWKTIRMGEVLERVFRPIEWHADLPLNLVSLRRRCGGLFRRPDVKGSEYKTQDLHEICTGDFLISKRQVVHGAWGYVTPAFEGGHVSKEYVILDNRAPDKLHMPFFAWLAQTRRLIRLARVSSTGVHIEKLIFDPAVFLREPIRIPTDLAEQQQIAAILDAADHELTLLRTQRQTLDQQKRGLMQRLLTGKLRVTP
jgi:type I restriction enzyme S subunit